MHDGDLRSGDHSDDGRQDVLRYSSVTDDQRTTMSAIRAILRAVDRAGFDPHDPADMDRLSDNLRRQDETGKRRTERGKRWGQYWIIGLTAFLTGLVGYAGGITKWIGHLIPAGWWHGTGGTP